MAQIDWDADRKRRVYSDLLPHLTDAVAKAKTGADAKKIASCISFLAEEIGRLRSKSAEAAMEQYGEAAAQAMGAP